MHDDITRLTKGDRFTATTTSVNRGVRTFREYTHVASRDQEIEHFIPADGDRPAQDRVFVEQPTRFWDIPTISVPTLVVAGSIRIEVAA